MILGINKDNTFKEGTFVIAKTNPDAKLLITKYYQRIYYCTPIKNPSGKLLAYFEKELIPAPN